MSFEMSYTYSNILRYNIIVFLEHKIIRFLIILENF